MTQPGGQHEQVADQLEQMCAPAGQLALGGPRASAAQPADFVHGTPRPSRQALWDEITGRYLARQTGIERDGKAALLTAGAPGAGKSTALDRLGLASESWRRLDADIVKTYLLEHDVAAGRYADLLTTQLADGHPLLPAELASLVHLESVAILERIRGLCLERGENVLLDGTLTWEPAAAALLEQLVSRQYQQVTILDVEVTRDTAHQQALQRWWTGRQTTITTGAGTGGRFLPAAAIDRAYTPTETAPPPGPPRQSRQSNAAAIARRLFDSDTGRPLQSMRLTVVDNTGRSPVIETHERLAGQPVRQVGGQRVLPGLGPSVIPLHPRPQRRPGPRDFGR